MTQNIALNSGDVAIEPFFDATQEMLGAAAPNFRVYIQSTTTLRLAAGSGNDQQCVAVNGRYRFRTSNTDAVHPGGSAGTHSVYVTASNNSFTGASPTTDNTNYAFGLEIKTSGTPTGVDQFRKIGEVDWDGSAITAFRQQVGSRHDGDPAFLRAPLASVSPLQVAGAASQSAPLARFVSSTGTTLASVTAAGGASFGDTVTMPASGLTISDTNLYRSAANVLKTDDAFFAAGNVTLGGTTAATVGFYGGAGAAQTTGWSVTNVSTDKAFNASNTTVNELANVLGTLINTLKATNLLGS